MVTESHTFREDDAYDYTHQEQIGLVFTEQVETFQANDDKIELTLKMAYIKDSEIGGIDEKAVIKALHDLFKTIRLEKVNNIMIQGRTEDEIKNIFLKSDATPFTALVVAVYEIHDGKLLVQMPYDGEVNKLRELYYELRLLGFRYLTKQELDDFAMYLNMPKEDYFPAINSADAFNKLYREKIAEPTNIN